MNNTLYPDISFLKRLLGSHFPVPRRDTSQFIFVYVSLIESNMLTTIYAL